MICEYLWHKWCQTNRQDYRKMCHQDQTPIGSHISHPLFVTMGRSPPGWSVATHSSTDHFWSGRQAPSHRLALRICWRVYEGWVASHASLQSSGIFLMWGFTGIGPNISEHRVPQNPVRDHQLTFVIFGQIMTNPDPLSSLVKSLFRNSLYHGYMNPYGFDDHPPWHNLWWNPVTEVARPLNGYTMLYNRILGKRRGKFHFQWTISESSPS